MDFRQRVASALESRWGKALFVLLIIMSGIAIGLETDPDIEREDAAILHAFDRVVLTIFTVEIALRIYVARSLRGYLRDPWNVFDLFIVGCCYLPQVGTYLAVGRLVRLLRVMRVMTVFPSLRRLIEALVRSIPSMGHILGLLVLVMYFYSVVGTFWFRHHLPELFGSLSLSALSLFRVATLDGGLDVMFAAMKVSPMAWTFFVSYIVLVAFIVVNLFVGVIVDSMSETRHYGKPDPNEAILAELAAIRQALEQRRKEG